MMKAIFLPDYNANIIRAMRSLEVRETVIPVPGENEVLLKVIAAPCNPSDIAFMRGGYGISKPVPVVMGFECTGQVIESGTGQAAIALLGKKVSCFIQGIGNGTWSEYFLADAEDCIPVSDDLPAEQAAAFCINPFTACALHELAQNRFTPAIIQNGASGQVGIFLRNLAARSGIQVINLVRKEEQVEILKDEGESHVICIMDPDFESRLHHLSHELNAIMAFDAVGGDMSGMMLNAMPPGSELVIYGGLSGKPAGLFSTLDIIFEGKKISGFNLGDWKKQKSDAEFAAISDYLQQLMVDGSLQTRIQGSFRLEEVQQAIEQYIRNMSAGKILFKP
jgi:NADPH:quinone reductase-like Zn-dependent oxidoreductase